jgi:hypothetical protein
VALEAQHAFEFDGVNGVLLDSVSAADIYGDFVYLGANARRVWTTNAVVRHNHFARNGRQGIAIISARDVVVENNYFGDVRRTSIDIEPNSAADGAQHVSIRNNTFGPTRLNFLSSHGAAGLIDGITVENNTLIGHSLIISVRPPEGRRRSRFRILNNTSDRAFGAPVPLMRFTRVDSVEVRGNSQQLQRRQLTIGVGAVESCYVTVSGNQFMNALREADIQPTMCP